jgi:hypothetical protein
MDVVNQYCGACHKFHPDSPPFDRTFATLAIGHELDRMARFYNCPRRDGEPDGELRTRLLVVIPDSPPSRPASVPDSPLTPGTTDKTEYGRWLATRPRIGPRQ